MPEIEARKLLPEKVGERLLSFIQKHDLWGRRLPSQRDLADTLAVSLVTVHKGIRQLRQAGVLVSVPRQGTYVVNRPPVLRNLAQRARMIFLSNLGKDPRLPGIYRRMIAPVQIHAASKGMDSVFVRLHDADDGTTFTTHYPPVPGSCLVFIGLAGGIDFVRRTIRTYKCPAVLLDYFDEDLGIPCIMDDGTRCMQKVVQHLLELGHRRIAYLDNSKPEINPWKREGCLLALREYGVNPQDRKIIACPQDLEAIEKKVHDILNKPRPPTAFVAVDDTRAMAAMRAVDAMGLQPGRDVSVAGYGDQEHRRGRYKELTSVRFEFANIGEAAVSALTGGEHEGGRLIMIDGELVARRSTGPATRAKEGTPKPKR